MTISLGAEPSSRRRFGGRNSVELIGSEEIIPAAKGSAHGSV
jgi:hypothetical protein